MWTVFFAGEQVYGPPRGPTCVTLAAKTPRAQLCVCVRPSSGCALRLHAVAFAVTCASWHLHSALGSPLGTVSVPASAE